MEQFLRVKKVFESLSQLGSSSHRDLFNTRLTQLSPILRYCEYNLKRAEGENAAALLDLLSSADNSQLSQQLADLIQNELVESSEELRVVSFRGLFLPVETEELRKAFQEVRAAEQALLRLRDSRGEDEERVLESFGRVFEAFDRVMRVLSTERDRLSKSANGLRFRDTERLFAVEKLGKQRRIVERNVLILNGCVDALRSGQSTNWGNLVAL